MLCAWCGGPIPPEARDLSVYCGRKHRQAAWRFRQARAELEARVSPRRRAPLRMAYADPPYPGLARKCYGREASYAGEVNHPELLERLAREYDGWALSTGSYALAELLPLAPRGARIGSWVKPDNPGRRRRARGPMSLWEPVIVVPGRRFAPATPDWFACGTSKAGLTGAKPIEYVAWVFAMMGLLPGDELDDLYPGTGIVTRCWRELQRMGRVERGSSATRRASSTDDASRTTSARHVDHRGGATRVDEGLPATRREACSVDASRVGRRRRVPLGDVVWLIHRRNERLTHGIQGRK
jgi:hypothetical protein